MKGRWKKRVISWILAILMLVTSVGFDSMGVSASESVTEDTRIEVEIPDLVTEEAAEETEAIAEEGENITEVQNQDEDMSIDAATDFELSSNVEASYTKASVQVALLSIGGETPTGSNNADIYIKPSDMSDYQQIGWYQGFSDNMLTISDIQYQYQPLTPGVKYDLKIVLRHENNIIGEKVIDFKTKTITVIPAEKLVTWFSAAYQITVPEKEQLKEEGIKSLKVYPYIQKKDGEAVKAEVGGDGIDLLKDDLTIRNLEEDTEYTVYFAGTRNGYQPYVSKFDFKTIKDTRKLKVVSDDIQYCYAAFNIAVSGGRDDVETKSYFFLRKVGDTKWIIHRNSDKKEAFTREYKMSDLDAETEYEYVLAIGDDWNINNPDQITKDGHKISGEFKTPEDPRELNVTCSAGYQTALMKASFSENNLSGVQTVIHAFVRESKTDGEWTEVKAGSWEQGGTLDLVFTNLKQDTQYDYKVILNSKWDDTTADTVVGKKQLKTGKFKTDLCKYTLQVTPDEKKSIYNREYLDVQLTGSKNDLKVDLEIIFSNAADKKVSLYRDEDYKDTFSIKYLNAATTYYVSKYSLYVKEFGEYVCIKEVTCGENDYSFTTPEAVVPTKVEFEEEELFLNMAQPTEENVGYVVLKPIVNEGACDEMLWESLDPEVATVDAYGKVTAVKVGVTQIVATSKYDENVTTSIKVNVGNLTALYEEGGENVNEVKFKGLKGTTTDAIILSGMTPEMEEAAGLEVTGSNAIRSSVAQYDKETKKITYGTVGTTKLYLEHNGYKVRLSVESYIETAAYYVSDLTNNKYPSVVTAENTYDLLVGQTYQINLKSINGAAIKDYNNFDVLIENDPKNCISINSKNFKLTANEVTTAPIKITISPKEGTEYDNEYYSDAVIYVNVKALPEEIDEIMFVYINEDKYLSDVELSDGWKWENENVALYALRNTDSYEFTAYYAKDDKYPAKKTVHVALAELKNLTVEDVSKNHFNVTADGEDKILVKVNYTFDGQIELDDIENALTANSEDVVITLKSAQFSEAIFEVSVKTAGTYELTAALNSVNYKKAILSKTVTLNATESPYVREIKVQNTTKEPAEFLEDDELLLDATTDIGKTITLKAFTYDYKENEMEAPKLIWTSTDNKVAQIAPASKTDTQNAKLVIKGEGNAIITVKSTDPAAISYTFVVEVKNIAPRVEGNKVSINTALDYNLSEGRDIAYKFYGFTEIVEAYDNKVLTYDFYQKTAKTYELEKDKGLKSTIFKFNERIGTGNKKDILTMPIDPDLKAGKYEMWLVIKTELSDAEYAYPVTVTVMNKPMKVSAASDNINVFYMLRNNDNIAYTFTGDYILNPTVNWTDKAEKALGFGVNKYIYYNISKKKWCSSVDTTQLEMNGRVPAENTTVGTLEFFFRGYRDTVKIENFKMKYCYKIPAITTVDAKTTISTECGIDTASFYLYQKDVKQRIKFHDEENKYAYSSYKSNIEEVNVYPTSDWSDYMEYKYTGDKKTENLVITLRSNYWREKVEVKHTINNVTPTLVLEKPNMSFNWNLPGMDTTVLKVKNAQNGAILKDVKIVGKNSVAQKLIDENVFTFTLGDKKYLDVKLNYLEALNKGSIKDGTYSYNVIPVFVNTKTGKEITGKACVLNLKTTSKKPEVNVSATGNIDLAKYSMLDSWEFYKNAVKIKYTFKNVNSNYEEIGREIVGDYAKYFELWWSDAGQSWYLVTKRGMEGKLKAGFTYNIQFKFTLKMKDGVTTQIITTKPYKLKLKQSTISVKVAPKAQTIYLSNENVSRVYNLTLSNSYYNIDEITGSLDVNKDGKADLIVENVQNYGNNANVTIRLVDRDAISTTAKGKNYNIPVEIMLRGADGVTKNVKTNIPVSIKK